LDGLLSGLPNTEGTESKWYIQLFRNGIIEAVDTFMLDHKNADGVPYIPSTTYENKLIEVLPGYLSIQEELGIELPTLIMLSLLGVRGYYMAVGEHLFMHQRQ